jgi:hypothetical protein
MVALAEAEPAELVALQVMLSALLLDGNPLGGEDGAV